MSVIIRFDRVEKSYDNLPPILRDLSFSITQGELIAIVGRSGVGKSTLLKMIPLIERPDQGTIWVHNRNTLALPASMIPYLRRSIGMVFQEQHLLTNQTVLETVLMPLHITGILGKSALTRAHQILDQLGLLKYLHTPSTQLSGGEQRRLCIARAIITRPPIILFDEPTTNLDPQYTEVITYIIHDLNAKGITIVITAHTHKLPQFPQARILSLTNHPS